MPGEKRIDHSQFVFPMNIYKAFRILVWSDDNMSAINYVVGVLALLILVSFRPPLAECGSCGYCWDVLLGRHISTSSLEGWRGTEQGFYLVQPE